MSELSFDLDKYDATRAFEKYLKDIAKSESSNNQDIAWSERSKNQVIAQSEASKNHISALCEALNTYEKIGNKVKAAEVSDMLMKKLKTL